jgi:hypothetical protein
MGDGDGAVRACKGPVRGQFSSAYLEAAGMVDGS